ncbi:MAG: hypothetical protein SF182_01690 [Deltaproteobacteria bacterium]|nr:hypothetical protein [Deltaproteobacteria bacterium]
MSTPALAIQPGASGSIRLQNGAVDVISVDGGDSASGTTRAANRPSVQLRGADTPAAQTDGLVREVIVDDFGVMFVCLGGSCNASGWTRVQNWALMGGTLGNSQQVPWGDVGVARAAAGVLSITNASSGRGDLEVLDLDTQAVSVADNGTGTAATFNLDPQKSYIEITCSDANGCTGTMQETSAREGRVAVIRNVSSNTITFADVTNVLTLNPSPWLLGANLGLAITYDGGIWRSQGNELRIREGSTEKGANGGLTFTAADFDATCTSGDCTVALDGSVTRLGNSISKSETTGAEFVFTDQANTYTAGPQKLNDNVEQQFGDAGDAGIKYDGTDLIVDPDKVGSGSLDMQGPFKVPRGTSTAPTTSGKLYFDTDGASVALAQPCIGDGTTCVPVRQCFSLGVANIFNQAVNSTVYANFGSIGSSAFINQHWAVLPVDVKLTNLVCWSILDPANTNSLTYTVQTGASCTGGGDGSNGATCTWSDTSLSVSKSGTAASNEWGQYGPDTDAVSISAGVPFLLKSVYGGSTGNAHYARCTVIACPTTIQ